MYFPDPRYFWALHDPTLSYFREPHLCWVDALDRGYLHPDQELS